MNSFTRGTDDHLSSLRIGRDQKFIYEDLCETHRISLWRISHSREDRKISIAFDTNLFTWIIESSGRELKDQYPEMVKGWCIEGAFLILYLY